MGVVVVGESGWGDGSLWAGGVFGVEGEEEVGGGEGKDVGFRIGEGNARCMGSKGRKEVLLLPKQDLSSAPLLHTGGESWH